MSRSFGWLQWRPPSPESISVGVELGQGLRKVEEGLGKTLMEGDEERQSERAGIVAEVSSTQLSSTRAGREGEREWKQGSSEGIGSTAGLRIRTYAVH